jgi:outer membrane protein OmpA-like peptidoglycan-associated protein
MKKIFVFLSVMALTMSAFAEETVVTVKNEKEYVAPKSAWFLSVMGGVNHAGTDVIDLGDFDDNIHGTGTAEIGYRFNPYVSLAGQMQYNRFGSYNPFNGDYRGINDLEAAVILYWNLVNTFGGYRADRKNHFYLYGGFNSGFTFAGAHRKYGLTYGFKAGVQYERMFKRGWAFIADASWNMLTDKMDCIEYINDNMEKHINVQVGIRKYFGLNRKTAKYYASESYTNYITRRDTTVVNQVEEVAAKPQPTYSCFFTINKIDLNEDSQNSIKQCAAYLKANPGKKVTIFGYADKNTGTAKRNAWLASNRARVVKEALVAEGVSEDRISCYDEGDKVQPYPEAVFEKNRAAIMLVTE